RVTGRAQPGPGHGDGPAFPADDGAVHGGIDVQFVWLGAPDGDPLGDAVHLFPLAAVFVAHRVLGVDRFDVVIDRVGLHVRQAPGVVIGVTDDHGRPAGERDAGDVLAGDAQMNGVPDRRKAEAEVRVAAQDRLSGGRLGAVNRPVVAAEAAGFAQ